MAVNLPEEMMTQIFIRLPVKSLLVCKSVCKQWLSTISSPHFIKSHLHHVVNASPALLDLIDPLTELFTDIPVDLINEDYVFFYEEDYQIRLQRIFEALLDTNKQDLSDSPLKFDRLVIPSIFHATRFVGSCSGIICLAADVHFVYLWNPSIRKCKTLAHPKSSHTHGAVFSLTKGFCYDSIADDYKVFTIMFLVSRDFFLPTVQVYSSNADSWTQFEPPNNFNYWVDYYESKSSIAINGVLYISTGNDLITFDLHKEAFVLVPSPGLSYEKRSKIMEFQGSAAMVFESGSDVALWTLDDVSAHSAWTKRFSIAYDSVFDMQLYSYLRAGQFYGKILIDIYELYSFLYDYETKETKYYLPGEVDIFASLKYTETLVSLDGFLHVE